MSEAEYLMKNYYMEIEEEEGVIAEADNPLRDLHYSSYDTKAEFNTCYVIHSK